MVVGSNPFAVITVFVWCVFSVFCISLVFHDNLIKVPSLLFSMFNLLVSIKLDCQC